MPCPFSQLSPSLQSRCLQTFYLYGSAIPSKVQLGYPLVGGQAVLALPWGDTFVLEGGLAGAFGLACHLGRGAGEAVAGFPRSSAGSGSREEIF